MVCNLFEVTPRWGCRVPHIAAARQCGANKLRPFQGRRQAAPRCKMQFAIAQLQVAEGYSLRGCRPMQDAICNCAIASCRLVKRGVVPSSIVTSLNRLIGNALSLLTVELDTWALSRLPRQVKNGGGYHQRGKDWVVSVRLTGSPMRGVRSCQGRPVVAAAAMLSSGSRHGWRAKAYLEL